MSTGQCALPGSRAVRAADIARLLVLFFAGLFCGCGERLENPRDSAEALFKLVSAGKFDEAYAQASVAFKFTRSAQYFEARARDLGLEGVTEVEWGAPEQHGRTARIRGIFTLMDGTKLPLNLSLIAEGGRWRLEEASSDPSEKTGVVDDVFAVASRSRDVKNLRVMEFTEPNALAVPSERELQQLAEETLLLFSEATLNAGDFSRLYEAASDRWKYRGRDPRELAYSGTDSRRSRDADPFNNENRLTTAALSRAFAATIEAKVDLSPIKRAKMVLAEPARVNSDGVLTFKGHYDCPVFQFGQPDKPRKLHFSLEYVMEASRWKLFGITVRILVPEKMSGE